MASDIERLLETTAPADIEPVDVAGIVRRVRRRRAARRGITAGLAVMVLAAVAVVTIPRLGVTPDNSVVFDDGVGNQALPAPGAAEVQGRLWPLDVEYEVEHRPVGREGGTYRAAFRGTSWTDWEHEYLTGQFAGECTKRTPTATLTGPGGCDGALSPAGAEDPDDPSGPSYFVRPGSIAAYVGGSPVRAEMTDATKRTAADLSFDEQHLVSYSIERRISCEAVPDGCPSSKPPETTFREATEVVVHKPTGFTLRNETRAEGRLISLFRVTEVAVGDDPPD